MDKIFVDGPVVAGGVVVAVVADGRFQGWTEVVVPSFILWGSAAVVVGRLAVVFWDLYRKVKNDG
ncbi:hypothetical protein [Kiloniella laminariae]|uniref:hypothetical protein n=1 Tax=Kiloniella laminariae TaxID=454162 RepID=UPI000365B543|nr:hypothetical protein [Kiloniella laminariae]